MSRKMLLTNDDETRDYFMQLSISTALPMVLSTTIDLGLLDILEEANNGLTAAEVAARALAIKNPSDAANIIDRMLHLLAAFSIVTCSAREDGAAMERVYEVAPGGRIFVKGSEGSLAAMVQLNAGRVVTESWYHLKEAVLEGGTTTLFEKAHGRPIFEYANSDSAFNKVYNQALEGLTKISVKQLLETYKGFDGVHILVDVGGGTGSFLNLVVSKYPSIKGFNFDLPHVVETAPSYPGIEHVGGDMFKKIPNADAILMKGVLHDWNDEHCVEVLKRCHEALTEQGKVIIVDLVSPVAADQSNQSKLVLQLDLYMLAMSNGKERTLPQFKSISEAAGFKSCRLVHSINTIFVIELLK